MEGRRTQEERRAQTIASILDAGVEALDEQGWTRTTIADIARRAGVTRGAVNHHFAGPADLYAAILRRAALNLVATIETELARLPADLSDAERIDLAVALGWDHTRSPEMTATREIIAAARTDPDLAGAVGDLPSELLALNVDLFTRIATGPGEGPAWPLDVGVLFAFATATGLALLAQGLHQEDEPWVDDVVHRLRAVARMSIDEAESLVEHLDAAKRAERRIVERTQHVHRDGEDDT